MAPKKPVKNNAQGSSPAAVKAMTSQPPQINIGNLATYRPWEVMGPTTPYVEPVKAEPFVGSVTPPGSAGPTLGELAQEAYYKQEAAAAAAARQNAMNQNLSNAKGMIDSYGMGNLWSGVDKLIRAGYTDFDTINMMLSQDAQYQDSYYSRFPAVKTIRETNKQRTAQGLAPIAEPTAKGYVELEKAYRQALTGLPSGTFGSTADVAEWIVKDVSPTEVADRAMAAKNYIAYSANGSIKQQLRKLYGMTDAEMASYVLSPDRVLANLQTEYQRRMAQATVGGAALDSGLNLADETRDMISSNEQFGNSYANTLSQMNSVREIDDAYDRLGRLSGVKTSTDELVNEQFGLQGAAAITEKKKQLSSQERARFSGASAVNKSSLSAGRLAQ